MDSFERNKIFMAVGFSCLAVLGIKELTAAVFDVPPPTETAYVVQGVEDPAAAPAGGGTNVAAAEQEPDWGTVLPKADVAAGEKIAGKCAQCHDWSKGGPNKIGPNLYGIVGNHHAHLGDGFAYSDAMKAKSGEPWDYNALFTFIGNPKQGVPGTKMGFAGLPKPEDRINVIAFLRQQSDSPLAIPAPNPAGASPAAAAPGEGGKAAPAAASPGNAPAKTTPAGAGTPPAGGKPAPNASTPGNDSQPQPSTPAPGGTPTSEPPKPTPGSTPPQPAAEPPPPPPAPRAAPAPGPDRIDTTPPANPGASGTQPKPPTKPNADSH